MKLTTRMPRAEYDAIEALNISRLKEIKRSPQHYRHAIESPKVSTPMTVGIATHVAILEPERYASEFAVWTRRTSSGNAAPRNGQWWEAFQLENAGKHILTYEENALANAIAAAVRFSELANPYLASGEPEVSLQWLLDGSLGARPAKGRVDWLTSLEGRDTLVGVKSARDCSHRAFSRQAANLGYHLQWAYYHDGFYAIRRKQPAMIEIVVENEAPHAVAVYRITDDILEQGREEYWELVKALNECEELGRWPGPVPAVEDLTLPTWAYKSNDDLAGIGLELGD